MTNGYTNMVLTGGIYGGYANDVWRSDSASPPPVIISIVPLAPNVPVNTTTTYTVLMSAAPQGISGGNIVIVMNNTVNGQITDYTLAPWVNLFDAGGGIGGVTWKVADLYGSSGTYNITLGSFTVSNIHPGKTLFNYNSMLIEDRNGGTYNPVLIPANFTVVTDRSPFPRGQPLGGFYPLGTDPNHDGLYEDLDGNGMIGMNDVVVMFTNLDAISSGKYGQPWYYDFDGNGGVGFNDVDSLYYMAT